MTTFEHVGAELTERIDIAHVAGDVQLEVPEEQAAVRWMGVRSRRRTTPGHLSLYNYTIVEPITGDREPAL